MCGWAGNDKHPLHLHVHHMQIVAFECVSGSDLCDDWADWITIGEWRDVVPTFEGKLTVRFRATDFPGETVLHCHFLRHEDLVSGSWMGVVYRMEGSIGPPRWSVSHQVVANGWRAGGSRA